MGSWVCDAPPVRARLPPQPPPPPLAPARSNGTTANLKGPQLLAAPPATNSRCENVEIGGVRPEQTLMFQGWNSPGPREALDFLDPGVLTVREFLRREVLLRALGTAPRRFTRPYVPCLSSLGSSLTSETGRWLLESGSRFELVAETLTVPI